MRKYFLTCAVALLTATNVNATTDYAEVTAKATIEVANIFECSEIDYGTIVVKQNNRAAELIATDHDVTGEGADDIISTSDWSKANSSCSTSVWGNKGDVTLKNSNGDKIAMNIYGQGTTLETILYIPTNVKAGDYTASFTVTQTTE